MQPTLPEMIRLAMGAGEILRAGFGKTHDIRRKSRIDIVTEVDERSEKYLLQQIRSRFAGDAIVAEESGEIRGDSGNTWYIDPLDGTTNYAHNMPIFAVSLAYAVNGVLQLGVVYDPLRDECFFAERGGGAFLNGEAIKVSPETELVNSLLVTGFPYDIRENPANNLDNFGSFAMQAQAIRRLGSAVLDLCYIAAGRMDGYWEIGLKAWDIAAGTLLVQEAGGKVSDLNGAAQFMRPPYSLICANPLLHEKMLQVIRQVEEQRKEKP